MTTAISFPLALPPVIILSSHGNDRDDSSRPVSSRLTLQPEALLEFLICFAQYRLRIHLFPASQIDKREE